MEGKQSKQILYPHVTVLVETTEQRDVAQDVKLYNNPLWQKEPTGNCRFKEGDYVYAMETGENFYTKAIVISF